MQTDYSRDFGLVKWGSGVSLHGSNSEPLMSALGKKRTSRLVERMSALPPKADIGTGTRVSPSTQQLRQPGDIRRDPACHVA